MTARQWLIDGNNVMGSRPDGWWNDPDGAKVRLVEEVARWCHSHDDEVTLVFDRPEVAAASRLAGGNLRVAFSVRSGRDAADDDIVERAGVATTTSVDDTVVVVTADRGLIDRLPPGVERWGPRRFLSELQTSA